MNHCFIQSKILFTKPKTRKEMKLFYEVSWVLQSNRLKQNGIFLKHETFLIFAKCKMDMSKNPRKF